MSDYPVTIDFDDHPRGDRWPGMRLESLEFVDGEVGEITRCRMHFQNASRIYRLDSDASTNPDSPIVLGGGDIARVDTIEDGFLPAAGVWTWEFKIYQSGHEAPITILRGAITIVSK